MVGRETAILYCVLKNENAMNQAMRYRQKAEELLALASKDLKPDLQVAFAAMAQGYLRLALLAERNSETDVVYETPPAKDAPAAAAE
jgi:hypothetical protein